MRQFVATLALLIIIVTSLPAQSATKSYDLPKATVDNFLAAVTQSDLQTSDRWERADAFFAHRGSMPQGQPMIVIGTDYSTQQVWTRGNHAEVVVTYRELGRIDSSLRFHQPLSSARQISVRYELIRVGTSGTIGAAKGSGPRQWKIQNPQRFVWAGPSAAAQYLSQARAATNNAVTQRNAERTLSQLNKLQ